MDETSEETPCAPVALRVVAIAASTAVLLAAGTFGARMLYRPAMAQPPMLAKSPPRPSPLPSADVSEIKMPVPESAVPLMAPPERDGSVMITYVSSTLLPEDVAAFYIDRMPPHGWQQGANEEKELNKHLEDISIMLFFRHPRREAAILIGPDGEGSMWTIILRPVITGGGRR